MTLTGLGLKFSSIVIAYAGGSLLLTAIYTSLIVWVIGLAVPVTASYIICAVIAAPALIQLGVPDYAAHMFIFYYAVLSEVSPPTALSPFAAAAITGGDPYKTTLQSWKYTLPAFLVPFVFVLDPDGVGLLLKIPKDGTWVSIVWITLKTTLGLAALAAAAQGWALRRATDGGALGARTRWIVPGLPEPARGAGGDGSAGATSTIPGRSGSCSAQPCWAGRSTARAVPFRSDRRLSPTQGIRAPAACGDGRSSVVPETIAVVVETRDFAVAVADLGQDLVGVLAETGRSRRAGSGSTSEKAIGIAGREIAADAGMVDEGEHRIVESSNPGSSSTVWRNVR